MNKTPEYWEGYLDAVEYCVEWLRRRGEHYPVDVFPEPYPRQHGLTVDSCSARALRKAALTWSSALSEEAKRDL
jgi:hypothetical protein